MSEYQVIARRWRPKGFDDLVGQDHIVRTLKNAIGRNRIAHAYLFVGPRGTGKTSTARVFAKALNAEGGPSVNPSDESEISQSIMAGNCMDVIEIDGASNNSVEQIRDLREECQYAPAQCTFKIYIIDEVHMLSSAAFNALLKTLEEPPAHVKFIFATTESQKVLPTIVSRCQRFEFRPISDEVITERLVQIAKAEKIKVDEKALQGIARLANGGMRDAQSILDQMISFCGDEIVESDVLDVYGLVDSEQIQKLGESMGNADYPAIVKAVEEFAHEGRDLYRVLLDLETLVRAGLMEAIAKNGLSDKLGRPMMAESFMRMLESLQQSEVHVQKGLSEKVNFEVALLKAIEASRARAIDALIKELSVIADSDEAKKKSLIPEDERVLTPITLPVYEENLISTHAVSSPMSTDDGGKESEDFDMDAELENPDEGQNLSNPSWPVPEAFEVEVEVEDEPVIEPDMPLLSLEEAISTIPENLREDLDRYLRAKFREVVRYKKSDY